MYNSLGVPVIGMIDAVQCLKDATFEICDNDEDKKFISPYFDFILSGMA